MSANFTPTLGDVTELKPFRYWCQKVLPLVFDDTLSYYELLCKVVDYLNNTMTDVNTLATDVENLHTAYVELQSYVDHYFDNLDVQNEINNKLDQMASSGALLTLIAPAISEEVSDWLEANITPTTPTVDESLTVLEAAADAKVTGDLKASIDENYQAVTLSDAIIFEPAFILGYSISVTGEVIPAYPANSRAATRNFYQSFGSVSIETDGTPYTIIQYDDCVEGSTGEGTVFYDEDKTFTNMKKYFRLAIKDDEGFSSVSGHITVSTANPLYDVVTNETKYTQNSEKLLEVNKGINAAYPISFNRVSDKELKSNKIYVRKKYMILNTLPTLENHYINFVIKEYSQDGTLLNTSTQWAFEEYVGNTNNTFYIVINVKYGTDLDISDELKITLENSITVYDQPKVADQIDNTFLNTVYTPGIFDSSGYILRPITDNIRITSDFFKIDSSLYILANKNADFQYYLKYYDSNFNYIQDGSYHASNSQYEVEGSSYARLVVQILNQEFTIQEAVEELANAYVFNPVFTYTTVNNAGQIVASTKIRMSTKQMYVKNGCITLDPTQGFDYFLSYYDSGKNYISGSKWYSKTAAANNYLIEKVPVKDQYVVITIAITDNRALDIKDSNIIKGADIFRIEEYTGKDEEMLYNYFYPAYYETEMISAISNLKNANKNSLCFAMYTDPHDNNEKINSYNMNQIEALRKICDSALIDFVILGGDLSDGIFATKAAAILKFTDIVNAFKKLKSPVLALRGNHDDNSYQGSAAEALIITKKEFYNLITAPLAGGTDSEAYGYYYKDFGDYRIFCLDYLDYPETLTGGNYDYTGYKANWRGYSNDQVAWFCDALEHTNKKIIVASHYSTNSRLMEEINNGITDNNYLNITNAMKAYNAKETFTFNGTTYDFSNVTGEILLQVSGHSHAYGAFVQDGIAWSSTGSTSPEVTIRFHDSNDYETMTTREYLKSSEAHFNVFIVNEDGVKILAFGAMDDITLSLS